MEDDAFNFTFSAGSAAALIGQLSPSQNTRRIPEEKGPFGKARKRGTSRTKTPGNATGVDEAKLSNLRAEDDIFGRFKLEEDKKRSLSRPIAALPASASAPNLIDASNGLGNSFAAGASTGQIFTTSEPTEVLLYGYGPDLQWSALSTYEKISNGLIYEEYDREPHTRHGGFSFSASRTSHYRSLSKSALQRVNNYVGGNHWIKVTFDSAEAAERACHYSPKVAQGYTVYAEMYRGVGPQGGDKAIRAEVNGTSQIASPGTVSSGTLGPAQSSATASSATATAPQGLLPRSTTTPLFRTSGSFPDDMPTQPTEPPQLEEHTALNLSTIPATTTTTALHPRSGRATLRLKGANIKPAIFLPQEKAFLPPKPRWQQTFGSLPIIGWVIGSGAGDCVPRKEDGGFDVARASLYWRVWYSVDRCLGSDFCGVREAEYDE
jgi:hypothetical protein